MKQNYFSKAFILALLMVYAMTIKSQNRWAMATIEENKNWPSLTEYHCTPEKGVNGTDYLRIYDWSYKIRQEKSNPIKLQYGYRMEKKQIFVYNFETNEERLALDFALSVGEHFTTYNGIEWEVEAVTDTLVNISYKGQGKCCTKRLLRVRSADGRQTDQWLEDFGSFANHLMILPMIEAGQTQTLWMEYDMGCYLVREISSDPLFTFDSGMPDEQANGADSQSVTYADGILTIEKAGWHSPNRYYNCIYRVGDDLYRAYIWELNPATVADYVVWHKYAACFVGLPAPQSGEYTMHFNINDRPSGMVDLKNDITNKEIYDLQGRRINGKPSKGVYIESGRKAVVR